MRVSIMVEDVIREVCRISLAAELQKLDKLERNKIVYSPLSLEQINKLAQKINILPAEYHSILLLRYCFENTASEIDEILETENADGKLIYVQKMLSGIMCLENSWIDDKSMIEACKIALAENINDYDNVEILHQSNYSRDFRQKLKGIKIKRDFNEMMTQIAKRAAVFILVSVLSLSAILAINAEAREKFLDWIIEVFPEFSVFTSQNMGGGDDDSVDIKYLKSFKIKYIPQGYELVNIHELRKMLIYNYLSGNNKEFDIKLSTSDEGKSYYDTENVEIEEIIFKDSKAYIWEADGVTYLLWHQDGIECHVTGNLNKDELIKVAENISK